MKFSLVYIVLLISLSCSSLQAQLNNNASNEIIYSYSKVDEDAVLKDGTIEEYLSQHFIWSDSMRNYGASGTISLRFTIYKDGSVKNVRVKQGLSPVQDKEAIRVIESTSKMWAPAKVNGQVVASYYHTYIDLSDDQLSASNPNEKSSTSFDTTGLFKYVDEFPRYKEGDFREFIAENYIMSTDILKKGKPGSLFVEFIVETDGTLTGVRVITGKGLTPMQDEEAVRVIKLSSGKWKPGKINGQPVRCILRQSFSFDADQF